MIKILVVEDEKPISDLIKLSLGKLGYSCDCAFDGMTAADMFDEMIASVREQTAKMMRMVIPTTQIKAPTAPRETDAGLKGAPAAAPVRASDSIRNSVYGRSAKPEARKEPVRKTAAEKVGRNDPCPCGSGKKYKKCCGAGLPDIESDDKE